VLASLHIDKNFRDLNKRIKSLEKKAQEQDEHKSIIAYRSQIYDFIRLEIEKLSSLVTWIQQNLE